VDAQELPYDVGHWDGYWVWVGARAVPVGPADESEHSGHLEAASRDGRAGGKLRRFLGVPHARAEAEHVASHRPKSEGPALLYTGGV